jgi:hypothetical protein
MKAPTYIAIGALCLVLFQAAAATNVSDFKVNDDASLTYQGYSNIATDLNGNFAVCWYDKRSGNNDIYLQLFDRTGTRQGSNRRVNDDTGTQEQFKPSMMRDQSGKFVVVWQDYRTNGYPLNADIYGQRYLADGTVQAANFKVNDDYGVETQAWQDIDCDDYGNFVVVWEDNRNGNYDVYAQRYHKSGTKLGVNIRVNDDAGTAYQHNPRVAVDGTGKFVIVWYDNRSSRDDIMGQRYDASGVAQGANFMVNDNINNEKHVMPDVACDYNGNFTVVWIDYRNGTYPSNPDIYGHMYYADGSSRSGNFKVNADGGQSSQMEPAIGMDYFGNYIIAWRDDREGNNDIYAQYYDNTGRLVGNNYRVNTETGTATQSFPNVTMDGINIYYTWTDDRNGSFDVYARITEYGSPTMVITPTAFQFSAEVGGANPASQNLLISNLGYGILNWRATSNQSWLQVTPTTGTAPATLAVSVTTAGLTYGSHNGRITIVDVSGKDSSLSSVVTFDITAPVMQITPQMVAIEAHLGVPPPDDKFVQINNTGTGTLNWTLSGMPKWLRFPANSGTAPSAVDILIIEDSLPGPGQYSASIAATSAQAINSPQTFSVQLNYLADSPIITTDPDTVDLTFAVNATTIDANELLIQNIGIGTLNWTIAADATWVTVNPDAGVGDAVVAVSAKPGLLPTGDHYSQLTITDPAAYNSPHYAVVHAHVTDVPPIIRVSPDTLNFICYSGGPQDSARTVTITNGGGGSMPWTVVKNAVWLSFTPAAGNGSGQTRAEVSTGGLPNGTYSVWAYFNAPGSTNLKDSLFVRLQIAPWTPRLCGLPAALPFLARENLALTDSQYVTVQTCAAPGMHWTISTSPAWLTAAPTTGTESQGSNIVMSTTGMNVGNFSGQVVVTSPEASNSPVTVPASLSVIARDTISLSPANVRPGQPFALDLRLHNLLPIDSLLLMLRYDNGYFVFDSVSVAPRLAGIMNLYTENGQALALIQTRISSIHSSSQLAGGNGVVATLHFHALGSAPEGQSAVSCSAQVRDSLGVVLALPETSGQVTVAGQTPVEPEPAAEIPAGFRLYQNFPNPFNNNTAIYYSLERSEFVTIEVLNIIGQSVKTLFSGQLAAGGYSVVWDGTDEQSRSIGTGIYFVHMAGAEQSQYIKAVLLK